MRKSMQDCEKKEVSNVETIGRVASSALVRISTHPAGLVRELVPINKTRRRHLQKTPIMEAKEKGRLDEAGLRLSNYVVREIEDSIKVKAKLVGEAAELIAQMAVVVARQLCAGGKLIIFGNGGSAADAQHIAAEFVGRYLVEREALPAIALTTDTSALTAIGNDYGFEQVFSRQIQALAKREDVALGISTSGDSQNVVRGLTVARELGLATLGLTGQNGGKLRNLVDLCLCVPSSATPRIQEVHILVGHILVGIAENVVRSEGTTQSPGRVITQSR